MYRDDFHINEGDVHVWEISFAEIEPDCDDLCGLLAVDEQQRAARISVARKRLEYVVSHGVLRILLGEYLDCAPQTLEFDRNAHGKPGLAAAQKVLWLQFNLSHSADRAVIAATRHHAVGVDIERIRPTTNCAGIAQRFFSPKEFKGLRELPPELLTLGFFCVWTRKEAFLKCIGEGFYSYMRNVEFSVDPREPPSILNIQQPQWLGRHWRVGQRISEDYVATVVLEHSEINTHWRRWSPTRSP